MSLSSVDLMILLTTLVIVLGIGYVYRLRIKQSQDFVKTGGSAGLCALALVGAGLSAPELIGLGAAGARWGVASAVLFVLAAFPALGLLARWIGPALRASKARTLAELLGQRFDQKTRQLAAGVFLLFTVAVMALSLRWIAEIFRALHLFDHFLRGYHLPAGAIVPLAIVLPALVALICVVYGGFSATLTGRAALVALSFVALLPAIWIGWQNTLSPAELHAALTGPQLAATGPAQRAMAFVLCLLLGIAFWCADFRAVQFALAAKNAATLRRAALLAALLAVPVALVALLPGALSWSLPTPSTQTEVRELNGVIYHQITLARPEAEAGKGAVPAQLDPQSGKILRDGAGQPWLDWKMAAPALIGRLPGGWLGLGLAALLASLIGGLLTCLSAFNTVLNADLLRLKPALEARRLTIQRLAALAAMLVAVELAFVAGPIHPVVLLPLAFMVVNLPLLAVLALGTLWKKANGHGAFAGLLVGLVAGVLHHGLTLAAGASRGWSGGWIAPAFAYPDALAQWLGTAVAALALTLVAAIGVSLLVPAAYSPPARALQASRKPSGRVKKMS